GLQGTKVAPVDHAVVASLKDEGIPVLNAVCKDGPVMRVVRPIQIGAVARREESTRPDVELWSKLESRNRVKDANLVAAAVLLRVEHELDLVDHGPAQVETHTVEREGIGRFASVRIVVDVAGLYAAADGDGGQGRLRAECRRRGRQHQCGQEKRMC